MKFLVLAFSLVVAAFADVSELGGGGYNYNHPSGGLSSQPSGSYLPGSGSSNFAQSATPGGSYIPPSGAPSGSYLPGGGAGSGNGHSHNQNQEQKHVYFYAAPEEEAPTRLRINVASSSNKNTKIIFIKAPGSGAIVPEIIAPPSEMEDKTLVYVLAKKQDQAGAITIPSSVGIKQAKPEVFFIKYKNQGEAEKAVSDSLGGHSSGSSLPDLHDQQAFVRTIKDTPQHGIGGGLGGGSALLGSGGFGGAGGNGGLGGLGAHGGVGGLGGNGLGGSGLGGSGSGYNYGPAGGSGPY